MQRRRVKMFIVTLVECLLPVADVASGRGAGAVLVLPKYIS